MKEKEKKMSYFWDSYLFFCAPLLCKALKGFLFL